MTTSTSSPSRRSIIAGRFISGFVVLFLTFASALPKLIEHNAATEAWTRFGYSQDVGFWIGVLELACAVVYAVPATSVLGATVLTGYLGGATATHVRIGDPWLFPIIVGVLAWGGLFLRDGRLRAFLSSHRGAKRSIEPSPTA